MLSKIQVMPIHFFSELCLLSSPAVRLAPLIKMVSATLTCKHINPLSKKPPSRPTSGISLHGPVLRNFDRANAADIKEVAKVSQNCIESFPIIILLFCPARHSKICV